ncbi:dTMP kinase [Hirschia litorea]|uniref:Thymidylate kinase n=1 Tax=Hirschia litorea TaxID=1199156 RepID=A0ABW2II43_9PROT
MHTYKGRFITLEGGEGVGKSTLAANLKLELEKKGQNVVLTREPGGSIGGETIRTLVLNPPHSDGSWSPLTQTLLFFAARRDHLEHVIIPALTRGDWVICDRFTDSTRAYQAVAGGVDQDTITQFDTMVVGENQPDLTLILDMALEDAAKRRVLRNGPIDAFESLPQSFHEKVRHAFIQISQVHPERCYLVDASLEATAVTQKALEIVSNRLKLS